MQLTILGASEPKDSLGVQESRSLGVLESRSLGVLESGSPGVPEPQNHELYLYPSFAFIFTLALLCSAFSSMKTCAADLKVPTFSSSLVLEKSSS